jgi:mycothiol synthase
MGAIAVREIDEGELDTLVELTNAVDTEAAATVAGFVDWRRQAEDTAWLLAERDGLPIGRAIVLVGWHRPRHIALTELSVLHDHRRGGAGTALLAAASHWARERRATELVGEVREDDPESLAWADRRGFREIGRNSRLVLELGRIDAPEPDPPPGIQIVTWADRPDLAPGMYEVACEAGPDIPGNEDDEIGTFEEWLSRDMQGESDRPEGTFVALADGEVVGFAKLAISGDQKERAFHDLTGVRRAWRGRGIASALKRTQIRWAKDQGYERLETMNEERNEPIRRLNERYGYRVAPGRILVSGPLAASASP